ncbi:hypothetical protein AB0506_51545, partial [Streptomyces sp. NPDC051572]
LISSADGGTFALPSARTERSSLSARYGPQKNVPVELRGAGACSRQVDNYCLPGGNWSSFPPHKQDEARPKVVTTRWPQPAQQVTAGFDFPTSS